MTVQTDIEHYLQQNEQKDLLRFITCGSVDDGKSTLIGRLLHDSKMIYEDQLAAITRDSKKAGTTGDEVDLALLVDGLQSEREQGITIDVAYRYFSTDKRKFIIADTPGHEQYTRNMATGASTADLAIILIDARHGVQVQTKRHSFIVSLLGIKHIIVTVNKMDLLDYSRDVFENIRQDYRQFAQQLSVEDIRFIPISALKGDNIVNASQSMPWFKGQTLLTMLETIEIASDRNLENFRFPVQYVNRPHADYRAFSGNIASGTIKPGDNVVALPSGKSSRIKTITTFDGDLPLAHPPQAVSLELEDEIDISRGDMLVKAGDLPTLSDSFNATIIWMSENKLRPRQLYDFKLATLYCPGCITTIHHRIDINTLAEQRASQLSLNEIAFCQVQLDRPCAFDPYRNNHATGSFILIDRLTNITVAAGIITGPAKESSDSTRPGNDADASTDTQPEKNTGTPSDEQRNKNLASTRPDIENFEIELKALIQKYFPH